MSRKEVLAGLSHIELTEDEIDECLIWGKQKKQAILDQREYERVVEENRKKLTGTQWTLEQTKGFMIYRASKIFKGFSLDSKNKFVFDLLCAYFSDEKEFLSMCSSAGIVGASISKGVMLMGNFGVGKTWLMKLFCKNKSQVFNVVSAKTIADYYQDAGGDLSQFYELSKNAVNDKDAFYQPYSGLCIDDLGTEEIKNHYGNKKNVIGDLVEIRYNNGNTGKFLHGTTNLTGKQLSEFYGGRVASRMREIFNFIELPGGDRRE